MTDDASEILYYRRRAAAEMTAAGQAADARQAGLHRDLARLFEERAELHARRITGSSVA